MAGIAVGWLIVEDLVMVLALVLLPTQAFVFRFPSLLMFQTVATQVDVRIQAVSYPSLRATDSQLAMKRAHRLEELDMIGKRIMTVTLWATCSAICAAGIVYLGANT